MLRCCKTLVELPFEDKEALSLKNSPSRHGYEGLRQQVLDKTALTDDKEGFYTGREQAEEKGFRQVELLCIQVSQDTDGLAGTQPVARTSCRGLSRASTGILQEHA